MPHHFAQQRAREARDSVPYVVAREVFVWNILGVDPTTSVVYNQLEPGDIALNELGDSWLWDGLVWRQFLPPPAGYTDEQAQDAVGTILVDTASIDFTYNDTANTISAVVLPAGVDHGGLGGLPDDDHTQYFLLAGRAGGQTGQGGTLAGQSLTLRGNATALDGQVILGSASLFVVDETTGQLRLPTAGSGAGLLIGGDAQLYRVAADVFSTPDSLRIGGYLRVGSEAAPTSTLVGAITAVRIRMPDGAFTGDTRLQLTETYTPAGAFPSFVRFEPTLSGGSGAAFVGIRTSVTVQPDAAGGNYQSAQNAITHNAGAFDITLFAGATFIASQSVAATTVTELFGLRSQYQAVAGTITTSFGLDIIRGSVGDAGAIGTGIALRIGASVGVIPTTDIAIQSLGGHHRFVGNVKIGADSTPGVALDVTGSQWLGTYLRVGSLAAPLNVTAGDINGLRLFIGTDAAILTGLTAQIVGALGISGNNALRLYDSDNSNFIAHRADAARTTDITYVWPVTDPTAGQVLSASAPAAGVSTLSWIAAGGGGAHNILDGGTSHSDSETDAVSKGSLIVGNATPKWDELVVGSNGAVLEADSAQTLGVKWSAATRTIYAGPGGLQPTTTSGCSPPQKVEQSAQHDYWTLDFDPTTKEHAWVDVEMPDNWDGGTLNVRFSWFTTTGDATKDVRWGCQMLSIGDGESLTTAFGTAQEVTDTANATANRHLKSAATAAIIIVISFSGGCDVAPTSEAIILQSSSNNSQPRIKIGTDRKIRVYDKFGTLVGPDGLGLTIPTAGMQECHLVFDSKTLSTVYVKVYSGTAEVNAFDTGLTPAAFWGVLTTPFYWGESAGQHGFKLFLANMVIRRSTVAGDAPHLTAYPRLKMVGGEDQQPAQDGNYTDWGVGDWANVDDVGANDGDTTVSDSVANAAKQTMASISANPVPAGATIEWVQLRCVSKKGSKAAGGHFMYRLGGVDTFSAAEDLGASTSYAGHTWGDQVLPPEVPRPGGGSWAVADFAPTTSEWGWETEPTGGVSVTVTKQPGPEIIYSTENLPLGTVPRAFLLSAGLASANPLMQT